MVFLHHKRYLIPPLINYQIIKYSYKEGLNEILNDKTF